MKFCFFNSVGSCVDLIVYIIIIIQFTSKNIKRGNYFLQYHFCRLWLTVHCALSLCYWFSQKKMAQLQTFQWSRANGAPSWTIMQHCALLNNCWWTSQAETDTVNQTLPWPCWTDTHTHTKRAKSKSFLTLQSPTWSWVKN